VKWVVVTRDAYETWEATTDPESDADLRIDVLTWVHGLQDAGPSADGVFDPFRETMFCEVDDTGVWIEYLVLPYLESPAIVIREYR
jgi:hypothetical protein